MGKVVTCPYCRQSFDRVTRSWRRTPKPEAENPLGNAVTKTIEGQLQQALNALRRTKDNERVLLAQLAEAERQGFQPKTTTSRGSAAEGPSRGGTP